MAKHVQVTKRQTAKAVNGALRSRTQQIRITNGQRRAISESARSKRSNGSQ